jgi:hypothetical protein
LAAELLRVLQRHLPAAFPLRPVLVQPVVDCADGLRVVFCAQSFASYFGAVVAGLVTDCRLLGLGVAGIQLFPAGDERLLVQ